MPVTRFIDRDEELRALDDAWRSRPCLAVIYGRRRIGKTRLVLEWCSRIGSCIYYNAVPAKHEVNLRELARAIEEAGIRGFSRARYESLDALLEALAYRVGSCALVIDEFSYWVRAEPRAAGELQRFVDHVLGKTRMMLVIVGSLVSVMHRSVVGGGAPLYGRARYRMRIEELSPWSVAEFYPWLEPEDVVRMYALFGGVPHYHSLVEYSWRPLEALAKLVLAPTAPLRDEALFILREEFREPSTYYSVLRAIAQGCTSPSSIASSIGVHRQHVSKYLAVLESLGLVEREKVLFSKRGAYRIRDKFLAMWFRVAEPLITMGIEVSDADLPSAAASSFEAHVAHTFEEVAMHYMRWLRRSGALAFDEIGRFVHKGVEIDIVALDRGKRVAHLVEVKWSDLDERDATRIARDLEAKARHLPIEGYSTRLHIVCRSFSGERLDNASIHTVRDMPLSKPRK
ncbi:MAG: ATP-binding protein [Crenarchaeota archaeon]|nr:ATP-binding protein [Thermoproteota archaeon]